MARKPSRKPAQAPALKPSESRRGFIRVDFDPGSKVLIGGRDYDALDLSVYGLSFLASAESARLFPDGAAIPKLSFSVGNHPVEVVGRVAHARPGLAAGLARVAVEFVEIDVNDVWRLARHVAEKAGVHKPRQIGSGLIELDELLGRRKRPKRARAAKKPPSKKKKASKKKSR